MAQVLQLMTDLADVVEQARAKLLSLGAGVADVGEALIFVQGVCHLASTTRTRIEQERRAFKLDEYLPAQTAKEPDHVASFSRLRAKFDEVLGRTDDRPAHPPG